MKEIIIAKLAEMETKENIRIIHAVESGSRAWGFASPDSDYDVRFIYVRPKEFYLRLDRTRDVIEWQLDEVLDINGWDLQKALRLLHSSNPTLFEWSNSPIVYKTTDEWATIQKEINNYFLAKSGLYHYLSTATGNYREYLKGDIVKLKKYFYVVRPILACKWILDRKCPPPMLFSELVDAELEPHMRPIIQSLLEKKSVTPEMGEGKRIDELNAYIDETLVKLKSEIDALPQERKTGWERLNELFISIIENNNIFKSTPKEKDSLDKVVDGIGALAGDMRGMVERALVSYAPIAEDIISRRITGEHDIGRQLDYMLDFCWDDKFLELYKKVLNSIKDEYPELVISYIESYKDLWENEDIPYEDEDE